MYVLKNRQIPLNEFYDVIVCGGGPAGCTAAISAAREGAKTLLLEATGMLGGMATNGLVNAWTPMSDGIRCIYGGLAEKIVAKIRTFTKHVDQNKWDWLPVDFERLKLLYDELVLESGADLLFHSQICGVELKDDRNIDVVLVANKAGLTAYRAKVFIDCTGDADLYAWAGKEFAKGEDGDLMPATMCYVVANLPEDAMNAVDLPYGGEKRAMLKRILQDGKYDIPDDHFVPVRLGHHVFTFNAGHVYDVDATDPASVTKGCVEGRKLVRRMMDAFTEYSPVFEDAYLVQTAPSIGIRESRRIIGDYIFTLEDYLEKRSFPDEVFRGKYYIDVHERPEIEAKRTGGRGTITHFGEYGMGESYGVPYRCMCPRDLDNLLVAGRTISSDRIANGSLRVMPCCLCEGEAVGIAAKFACDMESVNIHLVDTQKLRKRLIEEGAYLPRLDTDLF